MGTEARRGELSTKEDSYQPSACNKMHSAMSPLSRKWKFCRKVMSLETLLLMM